jgi:mannose-6-phosphate isomerase-like protein (cupin superfamily)
MPGGSRPVSGASDYGEFLFLFVLDGTALLDCEGRHRLVPGDAVAIPAGLDHALAECAVDLALLEVTLPV